MNKFASVPKVSRDGISTAEWQARVDLAAVYRLTAHYGWDDVIYNHSSMRVPGEPHKLLMKKHDLSVFEIEKEGFRLKLQRGASAPQATIVAAPAGAGPAKSAVSGAEPPAPAAKAIETVPMKEIVSPMVGTFYRAASPDAPHFV